MRGAVNSFSPPPLSSPVNGEEVFICKKLNYDTATLRERTMVRGAVNFFITDNKEFHLKKSRVLRGGGTIYGELTRISP